MSSRISHECHTNIRPTPFGHALLRAISAFWPLAVVPPFLVTAATGNPVLGLCFAFVINSLWTILFYWEDKYLAQHQHWRIPERRLHTWELLCGWPGALWAQRVFRHKSCKRSFAVVFWICVVVNVALLFLFFYFLEPMKTGEALRAWWRKGLSFLNGIGA